MGITISGENNNDRILASDGVIDQLSGFNVVGVITATSFTGDLTGDVTGNLTGNVTGNINNSTLLLQTGGSERIRITGNNEIGIAGANYGSAGQVLTSGGSGSAVSWTTPTLTNIVNYADNKLVTATGNANTLNAEGNLTFDGTSVFELQPSSATPARFIGDANRTSQGQHLSQFEGNWNGTLVGRMVVVAGEDTSNKDDGHLDFYTTQSGQSNTRRLRITSDGKIGINITDPDSILETVSPATNGINAHIGGLYNDGGQSAVRRIEFGVKNYRNAIQSQQGSGGNNFSSDNDLLLNPSGGDIIIGKTSGDHILDINASNNEIRLTKDSTSNYNGIQLDRDASGNAGGYFGLAGGAGHYANTSAQHDIIIRSQSNLLFTAGGATERLRITSDGKIGINDDNPAADLHVCTAGSSEQDGVLKLGGADGTLGLVIEYDQSSNTVAKITSNPTYGNSGALLKICVDGDNHADQLVLSGDGKIGVNITPSSGVDLQVRTGSSGAGVFRLGGTSGNGVGMDVTYSNSGNTSTVFKQNYRSTNAGALMKFDSGYFTFHNGTAGDEILRIQSGKVGINEDNPQTTLNVRGCISTGRNVAREVGTIIDISSNYSGSRNGIQVINGQKNYEENTNADWITANGGRVNANLTIDLGAQYTCDRFVIYNQNEYTNNVREVKRFTLEGSNDKSSWTTLLDDECGASYAHEPNPGFSFRIPSDFKDDDEGATYRYWRFTMKTFHGATSLGGVMELELYEVDSNNKTISEISTHHLSAQDISAQNIYHDLPAFFACKTSSLSISNQTNTVLAFTTDQGPGFDTTNGDYNNNNYRFNPKIPGYYQINMCCSVSYGALQAGQIYIYKNGSAYAFSQLYLNSGDIYDDICLTISTLVHLDGQSDYLEARAWRNGGNGGLGSGFSDQQWSGYLVRHAGYRRHGDGV